MTESIDLPPEIEQVADLLSKQRPEVRELFRHALVLAMIDNEKACIGGDRKYLPQLLRSQTANRWIS